MRSRFCAKVPKQTGGERRRPSYVESLEAPASRRLKVNSASEALVGSDMASSHFRIPYKDASPSRPSLALLRCQSGRNAASTLVPDFMHVAMRRRGCLYVSLLRIGELAIASGTRSVELLPRRSNSLRLPTSLQQPASRRASSQHSAAGSLGERHHLSARRLTASAGDIAPTVPIRPTTSRCTRLAFRAFEC